MHPHFAIAHLLPFQFFPANIPEGSMAQNIPVRTLPGTESRTPRTTSSDQPSAAPLREALFRVISMTRELFAGSSCTRHRLFSYPSLCARDQRPLRCFPRPTVNAMNFMTAALRKQYVSMELSMQRLSSYSTLRALSPASANQTCIRIFLFISWHCHRRRSRCKRARIDAQNRQDWMKSPLWDWQVDRVTARCDASSSGKAIEFFLTRLLVSSQVTPFKRVEVLSA
ncbi:hypothetical protein BKA70DRAFT_1324196, partial [Coprinopsis sp. MPI-PUGE-AT-0042]